MIVRDCMVYCGIQTSRRFARLTWFQRDFFRGLLHVCDDYGRFEADVGMLRTVLYAPALEKVSERDVKEALLRCADDSLGLVKLYTRRGRGYGKVINYRQNSLKNRRALYPDDADDEPELFPVGPPGGAPLQSEGKKEGRGRARNARHAPPPDAAPVPDNEAWVASLRADPRWAGIDIDQQLKLAHEAKRKQGRPLERGWFVDSWLKNCSPTYQPPKPKPSIAAVTILNPEPRGDGPSEFARTLLQSDPRMAAETIGESVPVVSQ